jgi:hypothetical protein
VSKKEFEVCPAGRANINRLPWLGQFESFLAFWRGAHSNRPAHAFLAGDELEPEQLGVGMRRACSARGA